MNCIDEIFEEFNATRSDIEISLEKMKSDLGELINHIVLYGAGSAGIAFLKYLNDVDIFPVCFADGKPEKWGTKCQGLDVISPGEVINVAGENALVVVTINTDGKRYCKSFEEGLRVGGHSGVYKMLREYGCKNIIDYTYFRRCHALFNGDLYNLPSCSDVDIMIKNRDKISEVYEWLSDDLSRETYEKIVRFRMIDDSLTIPTLPQDNQYFESGLYSVRDDACFVDCGAFNGISLKTFLKINPCFEKYYGFEPDEVNYNKLKEYIDNFSNKIKNKCEIHRSAVYDVRGKDRLFSLNGPGSFMADIGSDIVETNTIDNVLSGNMVSFIKMNIEGSEIKALNGAKNTISTYKPDLAVAGYHKTWDLWEIPFIIKKLNNSYHIKLRSYMNHISFVYYFANN